MARKLKAFGLPTVSAAQFAHRPPFSGFCSMRVTWVEASLLRGGAAAAQTFAWTFQP